MDYFELWVARKATFALHRFSLWHKVGVKNTKIKECRRLLKTLGCNVCHAS
jgi:hypothetical protein